MTRLEKLAEDYTWAISDDGFNHEVYQAYINGAKVMRDEIADHVARSGTNPRYVGELIERIPNIMAQTILGIGEGS